MKLHIATEGLELTPEIEEIIEKKLTPKLQKFFKKYPEDSIGINLFLKKRSRWGFRARVELDIPGQNIYAEESHKELTFAITALSRELARRLQKHKELAHER